MDFQQATTIPTPDDFARFGAVDLKNTEVVRQTLYDSLILPGAGITSLSFFATPAGQGVTSALGATVGTPKTFADTNMELAGQLPQGKAIMIESIELIFQPGSSSTTNTFLLANPAQFAAANAATPQLQLADVKTFLQSGWLEFFMSSKSMLREAPNGRFPPKTFMRQDVALATTSATAGEIATITAHGSGRPYYLEPAITIFSGVNFSVNLNWPAAVAMPSGFNGRVTCILDGYLLRARQ